MTAIESFTQQGKKTQSTMNTRPITAKPVDVLLGRGRGFYEWKGNIAYMQMISHYLPAYVAATKNKDKIRITVEILTLVKDSGGRFLGMDDRCGQPYEVSDAEARIKVSQVRAHLVSVLSFNCPGACHTTINGF